MVATTILVALLAGCGGGGGGSGPGADPVGTVKDFFATLSSGNWDKIPDYACAAQKDQVAKQFDPSALLGGGSGLGITAADAKSMVKFSVANLDVKEKSREGTKAVVSVAGTLKMVIDKDKFKEVVKKALQAAGQPTDEATLTLAMGMVDSLSKDQDLASDIDVVNEGGKWLICPSS